MLSVVKPGVYSTVQDLGRPGHAASGVPAGGAADRVSLALANRLVGNADEAAAIEMTLVGATLTFHVETLVAVAGASPGGIRRDTARRVRPGETLAIGPLAPGARCYLAVSGGIDLPRVLGSCSTLVSGALGGLEGRTLRIGDVLPIGAASGVKPPPPEAHALYALRSAVLRTRLRVVAGPHAELLGRGALDALLASEFTVSDRSDRVGTRLSGAALPARGPGAGEMVTEPMMPGAIQVPPDGMPIVLGPDAPVTGGYPVVASVIAADLPALGQLAPRQKVGLELVTIPQAVEAYQALGAALDAAAPRVREDEA